MRYIVDASFSCQLRWLAAEAGADREVVRPEQTEGRTTQPLSRVTDRPSRQRRMSIYKLVTSLRKTRLSLRTEAGRPLRIQCEPASTPSRQKAKAQSAFVERGLAVQFASTELALDVNGAFTGQENMQFSVCFTDRKLTVFYIAFSKVRLQVCHKTSGA